MTMVMKNSAWKGVLFDMDGVLVDSMPFHRIAWQKVFLSLGIHVSREEIYKREGEQGSVSVRELLAGAGREVSDADLALILAEKERIFQEVSNPRMFPGAVEILRDLKSLGLRLGLITGTSFKEASGLMPADVMALFDIVVTGDRVTRGKPDPEPYLKAVDETGLRTSDFVVVENAPYGIASAKGAGLYCIALMTSLPAEYLSGADLVLRSIDELRTHLLDVPAGP